MEYYNAYVESEIFALLTLQGCDLLININNQVQDGRLYVYYVYKTSLQNYMYVGRLI